MRLVTFVCREQPLDKPRLGIELGDAIVDVQSVCVLHAQRHAGAAGADMAEAIVPSDMRTFIRRYPQLRREIEPALNAVADLIARANDREALAHLAAHHPGIMLRTDVRLLAPLLDPPKIVCVGLNYRDHAIETGLPVPASPVLFSKYSSAIVGPDEAVVHPGPEVTTRLDYEVELAVVIGIGGKHIPESKALDHVLGYTVANDISARDLQFQEGQWLKGKTLDTFLPLGPAIVTADDIPDPHRLGIRLVLNDQTMQASSTEEMIFHIPYLIAYLSTLFTLEPGDLILTGTPAGVGHARRPPVYLQPGDVVRAEVDGIGALENRVIGG